MNFDYEVRRSVRARTMRISISPDSHVVVTVPLISSNRVAERFLAKHTAWVEKMLAKNRGRNVIRLSRPDIPILKKRAAALASAGARHFANVYGVKYKKISIRAQKSRWGSCSKHGSLSFNYKIAALPEQMRDYIIVHEICHLREMNHSLKFWSLVAQQVSAHSAIRKKLRSTLIVFN